MIPVYQTIFKPPMGNCTQACIASILELELDEVPNFNGGEDWFESLTKFMLERGLYPLGITIEEDFRVYGYHIIVGKSPRGDYQHAIVGLDGDPVHDPYPGGNCELGSKDYYEVYVSRL